MDLLQRLLWSSLGAAALCYVLLRYALGHWTRRGILHEKPKVPFGHLKGVGGKRHLAEVLQTLYTKYQGQAPFIGFFAWLKPMLLLLDVNAIECVLKEDGAAYFLDRGLYYNVRDDPLSQNQLQMDGCAWQQMQAKLNCLQWQEKLSSLLPALRRVQQTFDSALREKFNDTPTLCNVSRLIEGFNVDCISSLAFGLPGDSLRCKEHSLFHKMCKNYVKKNFNIFKAYLAFTFPAVARLLQYHLYSPEATEYFQKLINDKLNEREYEKSSKETCDFLQLWSDTRKISQLHERQKQMDNQEIMGQAFGFIVAGLEASNATLICCLYELALHADIQQKARQEIKEVLDKHQGNINQQSLRELQYLQQILNETLRKHSPYPFLLRLTTKDYELPDTVYLLQRGNHLIIPTAAIHQDARFYANPTKFDPEHFHSTQVQKRPACAFLPFGRGPRACLAQQFAEQQMLVCLLTLLQQFKFEPCSETPIPLSYDNSKLLRTPKGELKLLMQRV